ncbi:MAG TPA: glutathione S-transferase N-terminal domain-containing protein [Blastocatellia bacterium]|nr:glutathione S-transferase N-terminal domain-containing protein [Blastocatellia bacterium]
MPDSLPRMISVSASPYCELPRWLLQRLAIPFNEEFHAPLFYLPATRRVGAGTVVPVMVTREGTLPDARAIFYHYDAQAPADQRLLPEASPARDEVIRLFDLFYDRLAIAVRRWGYARLLPVRQTTVPMMTAGAPAWERALVKLIYPLIALLMRRALKITKDSPPQDLAEIDEIFTLVETRLADGRAYLCGNGLSAADLAFAALAAPTVLPDNYGGTLPTINEVPAAMRAEVEQLRARAAGRFLLRVYDEQRGRITGGK